MVRERLDESWTIQRIQIERIIIVARLGEDFFLKVQWETKNLSEIKHASKHMHVLCSAHPCTNVPWLIVSYPHKYLSKGISFTIGITQQVILLDGPSFWIEFNTDFTRASSRHEIFSLQKGSICLTVLNCFRPCLWASDNPSIYHSGSFRGMHTRRAKLWGTCINNCTDSLLRAR